jgi:hypothetical protein
MKKISMIAAIALMFTSSCMIAGTKGSGHVVTKEYHETGFRNIDISSSMKVYLTQGDNYEVRIEAEDNILDLIVVEKEGDKLILKFKNNVTVNPTKDIVIHITAPDFHELNASGAGGYVSTGVIKTNELSLDLSGATKVKLDVAVNNISIDASGASKIVLAGNATSLAVDGSGSTKVDAYELKTQQTHIDISGSGNANVYAERELNVEISGAGNVSYKGSPNISQDISGAGKISAVQ